jgi:hypothetical protein
VPLMALWCAELARRCVLVDWGGAVAAAVAVVVPWTVNGWTQVN